MTTMKPNQIMKHLFLLIVLTCSGCTVVSVNRTFPKLSWYWSAEAKEQRREREERKQSKPPTPHDATEVTL